VSHHRGVVQLDALVEEGVDGLQAVLLAGQDQGVEEDAVVDLGLLPG